MLEFRKPEWTVMGVSVRPKRKKRCSGRQKKEKEIPKSQWRHHEMVGTQARSGFYVSDREPLVVYSAVDRTELLKSFSLILYLVVCYYMFPQCLCTCINSPLTPYWVVFLEKNTMYKILHWLPKQSAEISWLLFLSDFDCSELQWWTST